MINLAIMMRVPKYGSLDYKYLRKRLMQNFIIKTILTEEHFINSIMGGDKDG